MSATLDLQKWIFEALQNNNALSSVLGGAKIYDDIPDNAELPYLVFGKFITEDWSTGTEEGGEHFIELTAWSKGRGRKEVTLIGEACKAALNGLSAGSSTNKLVNFHHQITTTERSKDGKFFLAKMEYRAVTEPTVT